MKQVTVGKPIEAVEFLERTCNISGLKVECLGMTPTLCLVDDDNELLNIEVTEDMLKVKGRKEIEFPLKLIRRLTAVEKHAVRRRVYNSTYEVTVSELYFLQFLKEDVQKEILSAENKQLQSLKEKRSK